MTEIDPEIFEKAAKWMCRNDAPEKIRGSLDEMTAWLDKWPRYMQESRDLLHAIGLPELLRKDREYDALLARVESAPVKIGFHEYAGGNCIEFEWETAEEASDFYGKRVRLLAE